MLSALVLGQLIASAKGAFDIKAGEVKEIAAKIVLLDRSLRQYGPETKPIRDLIQQTIESMVNLSWLESDSHAKSRVPAEGAPGPGSTEEVQLMLRALSPTNDTQRTAQSQSLQLSNDIGQTRWLLFAQRGSSIPMPFLIVLVWWLAVIFGSLGLFAPRNGTVYSIIFACALSASSAIYLILALNQPFEGLLRISDAPLRIAISQLSRWDRSDGAEPTAGDWATVVYGLIPWQMAQVYCEAPASGPCRNCSSARPARSCTAWAA